VQWEWQHLVTAGDIGMHCTTNSSVRRAQPDVDQPKRRPENQQPLHYSGKHFIQSTRCRDFVQSSISYSPAFHTVHQVSAFHTVQHFIQSTRCQHFIQSSISYSPAFHTVHQVIGFRTVQHFIQSSISYSPPGVRMASLDMHELVFLRRLQQHSGVCSCPTPAHLRGSPAWCSWRRPRRIWRTHPCSPPARWTSPGTFWLCSCGWPMQQHASHAGASEL